MRFQVTLLEDRTVPTYIATTPVKIEPILFFEEVARPETGADYIGPLPERAFRAASTNGIAIGITRDYFDRNSEVLPQSAFENYRKTFQHFVDVDVTPLPAFPTTGTPVVYPASPTLSLIPEAEKLLFTRHVTDGETTFRVAETWQDDVSTYSQRLADAGRVVSQTEFDRLLELYGRADIVEMTSGTPKVIRNLMSVILPSAGDPWPSDQPRPWLVYERLAPAEGQTEEIFRIVRTPSTWCGTGLGLDQRCYLSRSTTFVTKAEFERIVFNGETTWLFDLSVNGQDSGSVEDYRTRHDL